MLEPSPPSKITYSIVLPVYNEEACIGEVLDELVGAVHPLLPEGVEVIAVDDGSKDGTAEVLALHVQRHPILRIVTLRKNSGQSAAFIAGFRAARGDVILTMDADGQNDPADFPALAEALKQTGADCVCGYRANRQDTWSKRIGSKLANRIRSSVLNDGIRDTGCAVKAFRSELARDLFPWNGVHRFFPAFFLMQGARLHQVPVNHRARRAGVSKYTNMGRLRRTIRDLRGVKWLMDRYVKTETWEPGE